MKNFIKGMLFVTLAIPFLDGVVNIANQGVEYLCTKIAVKTYKLKESLQEEPQEETHVIGFQIPSSNNYDDDEEEE